jgi:hypothetical protein
MALSSVQVLRPRPSLGPDELDIAAAAFEAAQRAIAGPIGNLPPSRVREILAKYIAERALMGERDPEALCDGALKCLSLMAESSTEAPW